MMNNGYEVYNKAFKELVEILKFFPKSEYKKIPKSFIKFIEENKDENYEYKFEHIDDFQNQKMLEETKILLSIIYKNFIATSKEKEEINEIEKEERIKENVLNCENYNLDDIFKNRTTQNYSKDNIEDIKEAIIEYKRKTFVDKMFDKIKKIFSKNM